MFASQIRHCSLERSLALSHPRQCTKQMVQACPTAVYACSTPCSSAIIYSVSPNGICCSFNHHAEAPHPSWGKGKLLPCDEGVCRALQVWQLKSAGGAQQRPLEDTK